MPHSVCSKMTDYDQRPKSQHGIHKPEILHYIWFLDVGLHTFRSNSVCWIWHPRKHVRNVRNALFNTKVITISGLWLLQEFGWHIFWRWSSSGCVGHTSIRFRAPHQIRNSRWITNIVFLSAVIFISGLQAAFFVLLCWLCCGFVAYTSFWLGAPENISIAVRIAQMFCS